jgi:hypothetical protein
VYQYLFGGSPPPDAPAGAGDQGAARTARLDADQWHVLLGFLVERAGSLLVRVALSDADGDGLEHVRWRPLRTARYDAELDELELTVAGERGATVRFLVSSPRCALVEARLGQRVLRVQDASGLETVIRVRESDRSDAGASPAPPNIPLL